MKRIIHFMCINHFDPKAVIFDRDAMLSLYYQDAILYP